VEAQQEKSRIKQLFRQGEISTLLKSCHSGLETALNVFEVCVFLFGLLNPSTIKLYRFKGSTI
jgi:hypothetical protein